MLNGKQKRYLRSLANNERPIFQIGKDGISDNLIETIFDALIAKELIKVSVLKSCSADMNEIAVKICAGCSCELVQKIGRTLVFYKRTCENRIILP